MEKLNELAELANKATKGTWVADSGEGWDAIISQQDMVNSNFIIGEFIGPDSAVNKDFVLAASPENILAIAEAFRELEQEARKNLEGAAAWQNRAEAAEANQDYFGSLVSKARISADKAMVKFPQPNYVLLKVAEEAGEVVQAGVHYAENRMSWGEVEGEIVQLVAMLIRLVTEGDQINGITPPESCRDFIPAPAADLAGLVPDEMSEFPGKEIMDRYFNWTDKGDAEVFAVGFNACRAAILRNIEEDK